MHADNARQGFAHGTNGDHIALLNVYNQWKEADYAENCITDVASCLAQNNYDADDNTGDTLSNGNKLAIKACNPIITTCMSVNDIDGEASTADLTADEWIMQIMD